MGINIVTICGSIRPGNYTSKALALVLDELKKNPQLTVNPVELTDYRLPLPGQVPPDDSAEKFRAILREATGIVLATPEYHGSFSSILKLAIENMGFPSVLAGKPVSLLGVAAGEIGAIKSLEHLRSVCSHVGAIVIPGLVSVPRVHEVFDEDGRCKDPAIEQRVRSVATMLMEYIHGAICPKVALESMLRGQGKCAAGGSSTGSN